MYEQNIRLRLPQKARQGGARTAGEVTTAHEKMGDMPELSRKMEVREALGFRDVTNLGPSCG